MFAQLASVFSLDNTTLLVVAAVTFGFGFWEYIYSFRLTKREGRSPFPVWMHTFYFAHDSTWAIVFLLAAPRYGWHWFFVGASLALFVWTMFEVFNIYKAVTAEREEIWSAYYPGGVSRCAAIGNVALQIAGFYAVVNVLRLFMGEGCFFQWAALTNIMMAVGPGILWQRRGSRRGASVGLAIVILLGTANTFLPSSMFVMALPQYFDHPWYYIAGAIVTLLAARNLVLVARMPAKERVPGQRRPIW
jgi:hypothetical protein